MTTTDTANASLSQPVIARLAALRFVGEWTAADAVSHGCTLIATTHGAVNAPDHIALFLLVDSAGTVVDVRFKTPAQGELLAAYDVMAELCRGRMLVDAATISPRLVDARLRGASDEAALHLALDADTPFYVLTKAAERLNAPAAAATAPVATNGELPWLDIGLFEKVRRIEGVLDAHVRPALASDGGGIDLVDLKSDDLYVQYQGACGSCSSSIGGTLQFIQDSLNNHLGTALTVKVTGIEENPFGL